MSLGLCLEHVSAQRALAVSRGCTGVPHPPDLQSLRAGTMQCIYFTYCGLNIFLSCSFYLSIDFHFHPSF